jgi:hypothetical protein
MQKIGINSGKNYSVSFKDLYGNSVCRKSSDFSTFLCTLIKWIWLLTLMAIEVSYKEIKGQNFMPTIKTSQLIYENDLSYLFLDGSKYTL